MTNVNAQYRMENERIPVALTDSVGMPLGFIRTDHNSDFEAGQLLERYDRDRSGMMNSSNSIHSSPMFDLNYSILCRIYKQRHTIGNPIRKDACKILRVNTFQEDKLLVKKETGLDCDEKKAQVHSEQWELHTLCKDELLLVVSILLKR